MKRSILLAILGLFAIFLAWGSWSWVNYPLGLASSGETRLAGMVGLVTASILIVGLCSFLAIPLLRKGSQHK